MRPTESPVGSRTSTPARRAQKTRAGGDVMPVPLDIRGSARQECTAGGGTLHFSQLPFLGAEPPQLQFVVRKDLGMPQPPPRRSVLRSVAIALIASCGLLSMSACGGNDE